MISSRYVLMAPGWRTAAQSVAIAVAVTAAATLLRSLLTPVLGVEYPYQFFFLGPIVAAWFGGILGGLLATAFGGAVVALAFTLPIGRLQIQSTADVVALIIFLIVGATMSIVTARLRGALLRAESAVEAAERGEGEYRSLFELSALGSAELMPPEGRYIRVNQKLCELTGYAEDELLRMTFTSLTHPEDRGREIDRYRGLLSGDSGSTESEVRLVRKDGSVIWVAENTTALRDPSGKLTRTVAVIQDINERRRASEEQAFLLAASGIIGSSLDPDETLSALSDLCVSRVCEWCTITLREPEGTLRRVVTGHRDPAKRALAKVLTSRFPPSREHSVEIFHVVDTGIPLLRDRVPDGVLELLEERNELLEILRQLGLGPYIVVPLVSRGKILGALSLMAGPSGRYDERDLRLAQELASRAALAIDNALLFVESEKANRSKDEFFAAVSHELKTPMTTILGWSQMLQLHSLDQATQNTAMESIHRSALAQAKIIDDILDVARISTGKLTLEATPVDLGPLLESVAHAMGPAAAAKRIDLRYERNIGTAAIIVGDPTRLQQVFMNLTMNAVKFTDPEGEIRMVLDRIDSRARIVVTDTGIGIDPATLPYIFEAFRQGAVRNEGGLGLGLAIARRLVEGHGGTIEAFSAGPDMGSRFTVILPLASS